MLPYEGKTAVIIIVGLDAGTSMPKVSDGEKRTRHFYRYGSLLPSLILELQIKVGEAIVPTHHVLLRLPKPGCRAPS